MKPKIVFCPLIYLPNRPLSSIFSTDSNGVSIRWNWVYMKKLTYLVGIGWRCIGPAFPPNIRRQLLVLGPNSRSAEKAELTSPLGRCCWCRSWSCIRSDRPSEASCCPPLQMFQSNRQRSPSNPRPLPGSKSRQQEPGLRAKVIAIDGGELQWTLHQASCPSRPGIAPFPAESGLVTK